MMEGNSCSFDAVNIKNAPEYEFNEQVHVKVEIEFLKEEAEWGDSAGVEESPLSSLYAGHQVKDELVLGPEGLQPRDVAFTQTAHARGGHHEHTYAGTQPPAEDTPPPAEETLENLDPSRGGYHRDHTYAKTESSNAEVHVKEEVVECLKEEAEWEDSAADVASLYAGHEVKDELVLGPEGLQPRDIAFTLFATQASAVTAQPKLKDCVVRLERIDDLEAPLGTDTRRDKRRVGNNADVGHEIHSNSNIGDEKENYECDICKKRFDLKTQLMEHVMIHIHQSTEQEEINVADNATQVLAVTAQPKLKDCVVRLERIDDLEAPLGTDTRRDRRRVGNNADVGHETHSSNDISNEKETYVCDICKKRFDLKTQLMEHVMIHIHHSKEQEEMSVTDNAPSAAGGRGEGRGRMSTGERRRCCQICNEKFTQLGYLKKHERIHTGVKPFSCRTCNKKFTYLSNFKIHQRIHSGEKPFSCQTCNKKFTGSSDLKKHERIHTGVRPYSCAICKKEFKQYEHLKGHKRIHSGEKPFSCRTCNKKFTNSSSCKIHERIHLGERPFSCRTCNKKFTRLSSLKRHERLHSGEKPFSCRTCNKKFTQSGSLKEHERIHTGEKWYSCDKCNKKFTGSNNLKKHELIHTGVKPYSCDVCKKEFTQSGHLKVHERIHTGEKPFSCRLCNKKFTGSSTLKRHEMIHTGERPYSCDICKMKFTRRNHLQEHERIHTGEKCYSCDICNKKFTGSSDLKKHQRIHTGVRPYSCDICKKEFTQSGHLKRHERIHTGS